MTWQEHRELDARIHKAVFGRDHEWVTHGLDTCVLYAKDDNFRSQTVPKYTTEISAAWSVVLAVQAKNPGWRFSILGGDSPFPGHFTEGENREYVVSQTRRPWGWHAEFFGHEDPRLCTGKRHGSGRAATIELAICLASLEAMNG